VPNLIWTVKYHDEYKIRLLIKHRNYLPRLICQYRDLQFH